MKCPKCDYLGFDTGDRCKNCGYDFSLMTIAPEPTSSFAPSDIEIDLPPPSAHTPGTQFWLDELDKALGDPVIEPPAAAAPPRIPVPAPVVPLRAEAALPLFTPPRADDDDEPLIKLPAAPRPPLAVRKTPDTPRLRAVPKAKPRVEEPVLEFIEEPRSAPMPELTLRDDAPPSVRPSVAPGAAGARLGAAAIDHAILAGIDAAVIYFTLRIATLPLADWHVLPVAPLAAFLVLLKFGYFCAFTAMGGQTIGKMAAGLRVVSDEEGRVGGACAVRRTMAGIVSAVTLGLGFVPALVGGDRRALHDRLARTRVVALRSA